MLNIVVLKVCQQLVLAARSKLSSRKINGHSRIVALAASTAEMESTRNIR